MAGRARAARLAALFPHTTIELLALFTKGDQVLDRPLPRRGKGLFIKELKSRCRRAAPPAVHSLKDMPMESRRLHAGGGAGARGSARRVRVGAFCDAGRAPAGATVGTSSLRREAVARALSGTRREARGNVNTRLRKLDAASSTP
jgi:hydroxymethylbilane synthase